MPRISRKRESRESSTLVMRRRSGDALSALPAPYGVLKRLEAAARCDLALGRLTIGLYGAILGSDRQAVFPGYRGGLLDCRQFPSKLRKDVCALVDWALSRSKIEVSAVYASYRKIELGVRRRRRLSALGRHFRRVANRLMRKHPQLPRGKWDVAGITHNLMPDEIGKPLTDSIISQAASFEPKHLQIVPHDAYMNSTWTPGALTLRLDNDGYSVKDITLALAAPKQSLHVGLGRFEGELIDFFETGTEGVIWMLEDERRFGREALESICEGDHLTILDQLGKVLWRGIIRCDNRVGWRRYPMNPQYGQQCALGRWVHWIQRGFKPDDWARYFIRPDYDRLRGILVRRTGSKRDPRSTPKSIRRGKRPSSEREP